MSWVLTWNGERFATAEADSYTEVHILIRRRQSCRSCVDPKRGCCHAAILIFPNLAPVGNILTKSLFCTYLEISAIEGIMKRFMTWPRSSEYTISPPATWLIEPAGSSNNVTADHENSPEDIIKKEVVGATSKIK